MFLQRVCVHFDMQRDISAEMAVSKFFQKVLEFSEYESWPANKGFVATLGWIFESIMESIAKDMMETQ